MASSVSRRLANGALVTAGAATVAGSAALLTARSGGPSAFAAGETTPSLDPREWGEDRIRRLASGSSQFHVSGARRGVVAAQFPLSAYAALQALRLGGTAADAAVAAAFLDNVLTPGASSLGGCLGAIYHHAASGATHALDAGLNAVLDDDAPFDPLPDSATGRGVLVPGAVAGLEALWQRHGHLQWAELLRPATHFAREGFRIGEGYALTLRRRAGVILRHAEGRALFAPGGRLFTAGSTLVLAPLAETLERIAAEGAAYMHRGAWAERLVAIVQRTGGRMRLEDLARYEPRWNAPVVGSYLGHELRAAPPPLTGGTQLLVALSAAERLELHLRPPRTRSARTFFEETEVYRLTNAAVSAFAVDPAQASEVERAAQSHFLSPAFAQEVAARTAATRLDGGASGASGSGAPDDGWPRGSHGIAVVDAEGNVAALTHTIYADPWGDGGLFVDGVALNSSALQFFVKRPPPGGRLHGYLPCVVALRGGQPVLASTFVGDSVTTCAFQTTINVLARGMDLRTSAGEPRWGGRTTSAVTLRAGPRWGVEAFDSALLDEVEALGRPLARSPDDEFPRGGMSFWTAVAMDPRTRARSAVADPRLRGVAAAE